MLFSAVKFPSFGRRVPTICTASRMSCELTQPSGLEQGSFSRLGMLQQRYLQGRECPAGRKGLALLSGMEGEPASCKHGWDCCLNRGTAPFSLASCLLSGSSMACPLEASSRDWPTTAGTWLPCMGLPFAPVRDVVAGIEKVKALQPGGCSLKHFRSTKSTTQVAR